ncbi:MAG: xanthine dehydrogenase family protein molybdopterin-binding subunit, partial [Alphaproteobacteria bacterium]|nr:xanthine dehydrogenase family protein molybdopterin-binding subunit [Alphaproteobacteria bacterium]
RLAAKNNRANDLRTTGQYVPAGVGAADKHGYGNIASAYTFAVHGCCVKVDTLTGKATVEEYWAAHDAGTIINPIGAAGQVIGGVVQGLGMALSEATSVAKSGQLVNPSYVDDRVPTFPDAPHIQVYFSPAFEDNGPVGAKTIGEPPIMPVAGCVANAIYDAVGVRQNKLPMTPEQVWRTFQDHESPENGILHEKAEAPAESFA